MLSVLHHCLLLTQQVNCLSSDCPTGTYSSLSNASIGDLESGAAVCVPCHPLCEVCSGPGTQWPTDCHLCRFATDTTKECVESCNATSGEKIKLCAYVFTRCIENNHRWVLICAFCLEYFVEDSRFCYPCVENCLGCTGPSFTDCLQCASGFVQEFSKDRSLYVNVYSSNAPNFWSELKIPFH